MSDQLKKEIKRLYGMEAEPIIQAIEAGNFNLAANLANDSSDALRELIELDVNGEHEGEGVDGMPYTEDGISKDRAILREYKSVEAQLSDLAG